MDDQRYLQYQAALEKEWEAKCNGCGTCCGIVEGDPCEHLLKLDNQKYTCRIYDHRLGIHKTISGKEFECVPLRQIFYKSWPGDHQCVYKK